MPQAQRHVGVLGGVGAGVLDRHLLEADLLCAPAGNVLVLDRLFIEVQRRQRVHVVARGGGIEHVAFEHGVVGQPGERDAVVGEHVRVVLEVGAHLGQRGILEQRLERRERGLERQLVGRAGVVVRERDVRGLARRHREAHAHDARGHRVEAGGLGVEGGERGVGDQRQPALQLLWSFAMPCFPSSELDCGQAHPRPSLRPLL